MALLLLGGAIVWSAYAFGEKNRVFADPEGATWAHMDMFSQTAVNRLKPGNDFRAKPPTQEGQYDLFKALDLPTDFQKYSVDGWNTPLVLRVIQDKDQVEYVLLSAGPDRTPGTQDDLTSSELLKTRQIVHLHAD